jgi:UDP-2-acetamido-3-amino-2,3-dideoxy-glucuronate N-acetyltransferase
MTRDRYFVHETSIVDDGAEIGAGTKIWHFCHVMHSVKIGRNCTLGQNVYVAAGVRIGDHVKIQNNVSLYDGVELEDEVFCGPSCVFTNVKNPRSEISRRAAYQKTLVRRGASIGANATIVCGSTIGRYAIVGAGAVLAHGSVPDYALMLGVPARQAGWVGRHGHTLRDADAQGILRCPESGWRYRINSPAELRCLDWREDERLTNTRTRSAQS